MSTTPPSDAPPLPGIKAVRGLRRRDNQLITASQDSVISQTALDALFDLDLTPESVEPLEPPPKRGPGVDNQPSVAPWVHQWRPQQPSIIGPGEQQDVSDYFLCSYGKTGHLEIARTLNKSFKHMDQNQVDVGQHEQQTEIGIQLP